MGRGKERGEGREGGKKLLNVIEGMRMVCDIAGVMVYQEHSAHLADKARLVRHVAYSYGDFSAHGVNSWCTLRSSPLH